MKWVNSVLKWVMVVEVLILCECVCVCVVTCVDSDLAAAGVPTA